MSNLKFDLEKAPLYYKFTLSYEDLIFKHILFVSKVKEYKYFLNTLILNCSCICDFDNDISYSFDGNILKIKNLKNKDELNLDRNIFITGFINILSNIN